MKKAGEVAGKAGKVVGVTFVSQILSLLNAIFSPFKGTIFVFDEWEPMASKTAVAAGVVIVASVVALNIDASKANLQRRARRSLIATIILFVLCAGIYFLIKSGFAPTTYALFFLRDIVWMLIYIVMLVMVGTTIAFAQLILFSHGSAPGGTAGVAGNKGRGRASKRTQSGADDNEEADKNNADVDAPAEQPQ